MNCRIVGGLIGDFDNDSIVFLGVNDGAWKHVVDCDDVFGVTQFVNSRGLYL